MQLQLHKLQECMSAVLQHVHSQQAAVTRDCRSARAGLQTATSRLQLELASAGNIWLEEGCPGDAWMESCRALLQGNCMGSHGTTAAQQQGAQIQVMTMWRSAHSR